MFVPSSEEQTALFTHHKSYLYLRRQMCASKGSESFRLHGRVLTKLEKSTQHMLSHFPLILKEKVQPPLLPA